MIKIKTKQERITHGKGNYYRRRPSRSDCGNRASKNGGDYDVTILEGSQAMGGISQTVRYNGNRMDIGGHRFFSKNQQVMDWWADLMPLQGKPAYDDKKLGHKKPLAENGPDPETEDNVMLVRDRVSRIYYNKHFFDYPISMKPETIKNMGFVTTMKAGFSYLWACVFKSLKQTLRIST